MVPLLRQLHRGLPVLIVTFVSLTVALSETNEDWSFNVLADWSYSEEFATDPGIDSAHWDAKYDLIRHMYETYKGDLIVIPGDTTGGKWDTKEFAEIYKPELTVKERILEAARNCHGTMKDVFTQAGYDKILMAIGDHEYGGNRWNDGSDKVKNLAEFRQGFAESYNVNPITGQYFFNDPIGKEPCRPVDTSFDDTSYAYQHKNVLFITVDTFYRMPKNYLDRKKGLGGEGVLTCRVRGKHLEWFENVLKEAKKIDTIKHIMVQTHVPIIQPVRKADCSGQFMDEGEDSQFWKLMVKYDVDIYFAGEVHTNTVTKDPSPSSSLLQIVSRGNIMNNFLKVDVTDSTLNITAYNEVGDSKTHNMEYEVNGSLMLVKTVEASTVEAATVEAATAEFSEAVETSDAESLYSELLPPKISTEIYSSGVLELLDRTSALVHLTFDEKLPLEARQVIGMNDHKVDKPLINKSIFIRGKRCTKALPNIGSFGQQYDAQVSASVKLSKKAINGAYSGEFTETSRLGFYATGPLAAGGIISFSFWFKTTNVEEMIMFHYGHYFGQKVNFKKDVYTLTLSNGTPILYSGADNFVKPAKQQNLNNGQWHHISVSMPKKSCRLSEVDMYINGKTVKTNTPQEDRYLFFVTSGKMSIGGFGYSSVGFEKVFPNLRSYFGGIDEFYLWSRPLEKDDLLLAMQKNFIMRHNMGCNKQGTSYKPVKVKVKADCEIKCRAKLDCWGFQRWTDTTKAPKIREKCIHFKERPKGYRGKSSTTSCGIVP